MGERLAGRRRRRAGASCRCTPPRGWPRGRASCRSSRSSTPATSRPRTTVYREIAGREGDRAGAPRAGRGGDRARRGRPHRQRLLHRLPDPRRGRLRRRCPRDGAAPRPPAHHRERMRGRRGRPGAGPRLPRRPSRPGGRRPRRRVREPHLPALGQVGDQRRLHRDLRRRRGGGGAGGRGPSARAGAPSRTGADRGRRERLLPGDDAPHGLPPAQPGAADHPRP